MTTKVNDVYAAGQFALASVTHFTLGHVGMVDADMELVYKTLATKATPIMIGAIDSDEVRVAIENTGAWTAADLATALGAGWTAVDFDY